MRELHEAQMFSVYNYNSEIIVSIKEGWKRKEYVRSHISFCVVLLLRQGFLYVVWTGIKLLVIILLQSFEGCNNKCEPPCPSSKNISYGKI